MDKYLRAISYGSIFDGFILLGSFLFFLFTFARSLWYFRLSRRFFTLLGERVCIPSYIGPEPKHCTWIIRIWILSTLFWKKINFRQNRTSPSLSISLSRLPNRANVDKVTAAGRPSWAQNLACTAAETGTDETFHIVKSFANLHFSLKLQKSEFENKKKETGNWKTGVLELWLTTYLHDSTPLYWHDLILHPLLAIACLWVYIKFYVFFQYPLIKFWAL